MFEQSTIRICAALPCFIGVVLARLLKMHHYAVFSFSVLMLDRMYRTVFRSITVDLSD